MPEYLVEFAPYTGIFFGVLLTSALSIRICINLAKHFGWQAIPNERSCHKGELPLGGGGPVVVWSLAAWFLWAGPFEPVHFALLAGACVLAVISLIDDLRMVSAGLRFFLQLASVSLCLYLLPANQVVIWHGWPLPVDRLVTGLCWLWFINLYNFMDGIDGLAASETIIICIGIILIGSSTGYSVGLILLAVALAGAALGFLPWNWYKSKIMLGDLGAIPIGFLIGFMLIKLAIAGQLMAAIILPLYFVADASYTLLRRILRGENFWQPHKEHLYQNAVLAGISHDRVVLKIIAANLVLIGAAFLSISQPLLAALIAAVTVILLLVHLNHLARG